MQGAYNKTKEAKHTNTQEAIAPSQQVVDGVVIEDFPRKGTP